MSSESSPAAELIRQLLEAGATVDQIAEALSIGPELGRQVEAFELSGLARLLMEIARRAGIPFSRAAHEWSDNEDVVKEFAWDIWVAKKKAEGCPRCGLNHDLVRDPESLRPLHDGDFKLKRVDCWVEAEIDRAREQRLSDDDREAGVYYRLVIKDEPGPWIDDTPSG